MSRNSKFILGLVLASSLTTKALAFTLIGQLEAWQTPDLNYGSDIVPRVNQWVGTDTTGDKNLGDEYRINSPIVTYGFDEEFLNYFGAYGVLAVDKAMAILNALPPVSKAVLSDFPTESVQLMNYRASADGLLDMKSFTLAIMLEHMGLGDSTHTFNLRGRTPIRGGGPCDFTYGVNTRNFDPVTYEPTPYVNGVEFTYQIVDLCVYGVSVADAQEYPVDDVTGASSRNSVATWRGFKNGGFYNQISRDDIGGLRYLYRADNYNNETLPPNSLGTVPTAAILGSPWGGAIGTKGGVATTWNPVFTGTNSATPVSSTNALALFGGVEKIYFVKMTNTSVLGVTYNSYNIKYTQNVTVSNQLLAMTVSRRVTQPDIIFSAADLSNPPDYTDAFSRSIVVVNNSTVGAPGPGNIMPQSSIVFSKAGLVYVNQTLGMTQDDVLWTSSQWASFDGTTNDPIVFPNGNSIHQIELEVLGQ